MTPMSKVISVNFPDSLAALLKMDAREFEKEMRFLSVIKLYETNKLSSGMAARVLDISRIDFLEKLADYKVSVFQVHDEHALGEDISNA